MIEILQNLEPIKKGPDILLYEELDECTEVLFFIEGEYNVGYTLNRQEKFPMRLKGHTCIGAYEVTYNKRTLFIYKTVEICWGYFIRKQNWINIMSNEDNKSFIYDAKTKIRNDFNKNIKEVLKSCKEYDVKKLSRRADYQRVLTLQQFKKEEPTPYEVKKQAMMKKYATAYNQQDV